MEPTEPIKGTSKPPRQPMARIGVTGLAYHHAPGDETPTVASSRFGRHLTSDEQPFVRKLKLTREQGWVPVPTGWLVEASVAVVSLDPDPPSVIPTEAESRRLRDSFVLLGVEEVQIEAGWVVPFGKVRRGEDARFEPDVLHRLRLRYQHDGEARVTVTLFPV